MSSTTSIVEDPSSNDDTAGAPVIASGSSAVAAAWDAVAGVWVGDKAAGHQGDIPSPLWIFGYEHEPRYTRYSKW